MKNQEFHQLRIGDIVKWGSQGESYTLLIKELGVRPSHNLCHKGLVLSYTGTDPYHWEIGRTIGLFESNAAPLVKVA